MSKSKSNSRSSGGGGGGGGGGVGPADLFNGTDVVVEEMVELAPEVIANLDLPQVVKDEPGKVNEFIKSLKRMALGEAGDSCESDDDCGEEEAEPVEPVAATTAAAAPEELEEGEATAAPGELEEGDAVTAAEI